MIPSGGGRELDPLSRRLLQLAGLLSVLLILVVANSLLHSDENPFNPVAAAAERIERLPGARMTIQATYTSPNLAEPMTATGVGAVNSATERSWARLHMVVLGKSIDLETIGDGTSTYTRGSTVAQELPPGKTWLKVEPFLGHSEAEARIGGESEDPLQLLAAAGSVTMVGHQKVDGRMTRRYRAVIDMGRYAGLLRDEGKDDLADEYEKVAETMSAPVIGEAWIDRKNLLRRDRVVMTLPTKGTAPAVTMDMVIDLHDYGAEPKISLPDPDQVYDATPSFRQGLETGGTA